MREVDVEDRHRDQEHDERTRETVDDREEADAHEMGDPAHRRHEGVLDGALPAFPSDGVGGLHEDQRQVAPEQRADQQVKLRPAQVEGAAGHPQRPQARGEEADRQHADDAVEEPHDLPAPVALVDVELPLGKAEQGAHLGSAHADHVTASSASSASSVFPVRSMKTSSSVAAPCRARSSSGEPSASTRPPSSISTRSHSADASSMSWVQSRTVISRSARSVSSTAWTSFLERGSSPVVGSSIRSSDGAVRKLRAMATFCCCPRDSWFIDSSVTPPASTIRSSSCNATFSFCSRRHQGAPASRSRRLNALRTPWMSIARTLIAVS